MLICCKKCGEVFPEGTRVCPRCREKYPEVIMSAEEKHKTNKKPTKLSCKVQKVLTLVSLVFTIIGFLIFIVTLCGTSLIAIFISGGITIVSILMLIVSCLLDEIKAAIYEAESKNKKYRPDPVEYELLIRQFINSEKK